mmetsp:Transcript_5280/g.7772  ORF Transcript_5280/g.7772 Transcript_5280/m.7772 type:complete len:500 (+) Transcript_5280:72-1571(+)
MSFDESSSSRGQSAEESGLSAAASAVWKKVTKTVTIPPGSIRSSIFTLLTSTVGSGVLALPYAAKNGGVIPTIILVLLGAISSYFTIWVLVTCAEESERGGRNAARTYQQLAYRCGGNRLLNVTKWILVVNLFGTTVAYLVVIATILPAAIEVLSPKDISNEWYLQKWFILLLIIIPLETPLGLMKELAALRYTAVIAIFWSSYLTIVTVSEYFQMCGHGDDSPPCFAEALQKESYLWGPRSFEGLATTIPIMIYSFTCQANVLPIYLELLRPSPQRMLRVTRISFSICCVIYLLIAIFGYLTFGNDTMGDYLLNDYKHHSVVLVGGFGLVVSVALCIPLFVHAGRFNIMGSVKKSGGERGEYNIIGSPGSPVIGGDDEKSVRFLVNAPDISLPPTETSELSWREYLFQKDVMHIWVTLLWLAMSYGISSAINNIEAVIGILGATTLPIIGYLLPLIFIFHITERDAYIPQKIIGCVTTTIIAVFCLSSLVLQFKSYAS